MTDPTTGVDLLLREAGREVTFDRPLADVVTRGRQIRRRRRVVPAAVAIIVAGVAAAAITLPQRDGRSDVVDSPPAPGPALIGITGDTLERAAGACSEELTPPSGNASFTRSELVAAAEVSDKLVVAFRGQRLAGFCVLLTADLSTMASGTGHVMPFDAEFAPTIMDYRSSGAETTFILGRASADVARMEATISGAAVSVALEDGTFFFWADHAVPDWSEIAYSSYAADGSLLEAESFPELPEPSAVSGETSHRGQTSVEEDAGD